MLTSRNAIVRHFVKHNSITDWPKYSGHSASVRNIFDINVNDVQLHIYEVPLVSRSCQEPLGVYWNYCAYPITRLIYPDLVIRQTMSFFFLLLLLYSMVSTLLRMGIGYIQ